METYYKKIFYAGIAYKECPAKGQNLKKTGLPLKKLSREYSYLLGGGRGNMGKLQIFIALLPEYAGKTLIGGKPKEWKREMAGKLLYEAADRASFSLDCSEQIIATDFACAKDVPVELWAVCIYQQRPFDSICISLFPDGGERELEQVRELIAPYLPRMKRVAYKGQKSRMSETLEDYLYEEYGIVMTDTEKIPSDMLYLDFGQEGARGGGKYLNQSENLKFLDTAVKNGYNTDVD